MRVANQNGGDIMNIIDLENLDTFDCNKCQNKTKRQVSTAYDVAGKGKLSIVYDCDNKRCKRIKKLKALFIFRSLMNEDCEPEWRGIK